MSFCRLQFESTAFGRLQRARICSVRQVRLAPSAPAIHLQLSVISSAKLEGGGRLFQKNHCWEIEFSCNIKESTVLVDRTGKSNTTVQSNLLSKQLGQSLHALSDLS